MAILSIALVLKTVVASSEEEKASCYEHLKVSVRCGAFPAQHRIPVFLCSCVELETGGELMNLLERSTEGPHFTSATDLASIHHGQYSWFYARLALAGLIIMLVSLHCHTAYLSLSKRGIKWVGGISIHRCTALHYITPDIFCLFPSFVLDHPCDLAIISCVLKTFHSLLSISFR